MMNMIMTIGGATYDIFLHENRCQSQQYTDASGTDFLLIPQGRKVEFARLHYATGGGATNTAVAFARQGFCVKTFFAIGDDSQGRFIVNELVAQQVNIDCVIRLPGCPTGTSVIISAPSGEASLLVCHGASNNMQVTHVPFDMIAQQKYLYIAPLPSAALLPGIVTHARAKEVSFIAINPGTNQLYLEPDYLYESLPSVDCLILNAAEARQLFGWLVTEKKVPVPVVPISSQTDYPDLLQHFNSFDAINYTIAHYLAMIHALGPKMVVVTDGARGAYVGVSSKVFFHPSITVEVCNTVGAGDAFGAAFVASIALGYSTEQAMVRGVCNSSSVLHGADAKSGLLSTAELDQAMHTQTMGAVQSFSY